MQENIKEEKESADELKGEEISNISCSRVTGQFISGNVVNLSRTYKLQGTNKIAIERSYIFTYSKRY